jgi:hypothetical protein
MAAVAVAVLAGAGTAEGAASANADPALRSLPHVSGGAHPGPSVLYAPAPVAPQLENHSPRFRAGPLLVSGAEAYTRGEYLYQDYLYDDTGNGSFAYPTDAARYANNAADLVEMRIAPAADSVAYRFTLNSLPAADAAIVSLAFDTDRLAATGQPTLPRDPGAPFPGTDEVITTWGTGAADHGRGAAQRLEPAVGVARHARRRALRPRDRRMAEAGLAGVGHAAGRRERI